MFTSRDKKVAFLETESDFERMKGFTSFSTNKNPREYTRQYVDEPSETTDVVAINTSMDFNFDHMQGNAVHEKLVEIINKEYVGDDAVVRICVVDFTKPIEGGFEAAAREFAVIPGTEGDNQDAYTYGGTFRVKTERVEGVATSTDDFKKTCTFEPGEAGGGAEG